MRLTLQKRILRDLHNIRAEIDKVYDPSEKAKLIHVYVDLLENLDVAKIG